MKLVAATGNAHKLKEFREILSPLGFEVISAKEAGARIEVEETGKSFTENAALKARAIYEIVKAPTVADDSGLVVDALDGRPGIYSARYCAGDDSDRMQKVLLEMQNVPKADRGAHFVCAICYIDADGKAWSTTGILDGRIAEAPEGENGFGYDPIFLVGDRSVATLSAEEKNKISHRAKALENLRAHLAQTNQKAAPDREN